MPWLALGIQVRGRFQGRSRPHVFIMRVSRFHGGSVYASLPPPQPPAPTSD